MKNRIKAVVSLILAVMTVAFAGKPVSGSGSNGNLSENITDEVIKVIVPEQNGEIGMDNEYVSDFFENYVPNYGMKYYAQGEYLPMNGVTLKWECTDAKYYSVFVDTTDAFTSAENYTVVNPELTLYNLVPDTEYFWRVKVTDANGKRKTSATYSFTPKAYVRTVKIDGVSNVRDLGGAVTSDGRMLKYGVVYRSAILDGVTAEGKRTVAKLGIKADLDLRGKTVEESPLGKNIKRINVNAPWYAAGKGTFGINGMDEYVQGFVDEIRVCANPDNYPMLFHCQIGRDRTGTLAATLLALCGVSREDIVRDYELSWLSVAGSPVNDRLENTRINQLMDFYESQSGADLKEKAASYLLSLDITQTEIDSIVNILVG